MTTAEQGAACGDCGEATGRKYARYCDECRIPRRVRKHLWEPTPEIDDVIRSAWRSKAHGGRATKVVLAKTKCGWPEWAVRRRARNLGLCRRYAAERAWSAEELDFLKKHAWRSPERIRDKLREKFGVARTPAAIILKRRRLKLLSNTHFYSAQHLGELLGEDGHKVVRWIHCGLLEARKRGLEKRTPQQGGDIYAIFPADVRKFINHNPHEIDLAKVEKYWFLDLITGGKCQLLDEAWR